MVMVLGPVVCAFSFLISGAETPMSSTEKCNNIENAAVEFAAVTDGPHPAVL